MWRPAGGDGKGLVSVVRVFCFLPLLTAGGIAPALADSDPINAPYEVVRFSGETTLRDFVAEHLDDPDLWPMVLRLNEMGSVADLVPGTSLQLPVQQVAFSDQALLASLQAIQKATAEGARLFAPDEIGNAISDRDTAIARRGEGAWREVVSYARSASAHAEDAYEISVQLRDQAAEALITDVHGRIEGRDPAEPAWSSRALNDILVEFERLRTLSNSTTQVTFRDLSRLRLNPNSNATIQRMRSDPLTGREVTKVSLSNGDFYALLNQLSDRDSFEIEVPGIRTTTDSDDFWIKNDESGARFVNYDTAALDIEAEGAAVSLEENQGVVISRGKAQRAEVLKQPLLATPLGGALVYGNAVTLVWQPYPEASAYWFEVAGDPGFNRMIATEWAVPEGGFRVEGLSPGTHFWRVAALDALGLPGKWSEVRSFDLLQDDAPPFLTLFAPLPGIVLETDYVDVLGASEKGVELTLNGEVVVVGGDGSFLARVALRAGENELRVVATDPAGNKSEKTSGVIYRPLASVEIVPDVGLPRVGEVFVTRTEELSFFAETSATPGADVRVLDDGGAEIARARVGDAGALGVTLPASDMVRGYAIEVLAPTGAVEGRFDLSVVQDSVAPMIVLDQPQPRAVSDDRLPISGAVGDAVSLTVGAEDIPVLDGGFATEVQLAPGVNTLDIRATDAAGNVGILSVRTNYDVDPPDILSATASRPHGANGPIEIVVEARDASGLRQAAPFLLEVGAEEREGFLRCDSVSGLCRATLPAEAGDLALIEVVVMDYAGNEAFQ